MFGISQPTARKSKASLMNNNEAVSPIIGVILMVAVTVILAAIVAAFFFGMTNNMPRAPQVSYFGIERTAENTVTISYTAPISCDLTAVQVFVNGDPVEESALLASPTGDGSYLNLTTSGDCGYIAFDNVGVPGLTNPSDITIKARVNGASLQVIESATV